MTNNQRVVKQYATDNLAAATIIASDPALYPEGGLMATWADVILSRAANPDQSEAGPLFAKRAA